MREVLMMFDYAAKPPLWGRGGGALWMRAPLEPELRERVEDVVLNRRPDASERLLEIAENAKSAAKDDAPAE